MRRIGRRDATQPASSYGAPKAGRLWLPDSVAFRLEWATLRRETRLAGQPNPSRWNGSIV